MYYRDIVSNIIVFSVFWVSRVRLFIVLLCLASASVSSSESYFLGLDAAKRAQYDQASSAWVALAKSGDPAAAYGMGILYSNGLGGDRDVEAAIKYFQYAASNGVPDAFFRIAEIYELSNTSESALIAHAWLHTFQLTFSKDKELVELAEKKQIVLLESVTFHMQGLASEWASDVMGILKSNGGGRKYDGSDLYLELFPNKIKTVQTNELNQPQDDKNKMGSLAMPTPFTNFLHTMAGAEVSMFNIFLFSILLGIAAVIAHRPIIKLYKRIVLSLSNRTSRRKRPYKAEQKHQDDMSFHKTTEEERQRSESEKAQRETAAKDRDRQSKASRDHEALVRAEREEKAKSAQRHQDEFASNTTAEEERQRSKSEKALREATAKERDLKTKEARDRQAHIISEREAKANREATSKERDLKSKELRDRQARLQSQKQEIAETKMAEAKAKQDHATKKRELATAAAKKAAADKKEVKAQKKKEIADKKREDKKRTDHEKTMLEERLALQATLEAEQLRVEEEKHKHHVYKQSLTILKRNLPFYCSSKDIEGSSGRVDSHTWLAVTDAVRKVDSSDLTLYLVRIKNQLDGETYERVGITSKPVVDVFKKSTEVELVDVLAECSAERWYILFLEYHLLREFRPTGEVSDALGIKPPKVEFSGMSKIIRPNAIDKITSYINLLPEHRQTTIDQIEVIKLL